MKRTIVATMTVLLMVCSGIAQDQEKPVDIYVGAGLSVPTGTLGDGWNLGFHGNGRVGFDAAPKLEILGSVGYHAFPIDIDGVDGGTFSAIMFGGDLKVNFGQAGQQANPYVLGGAGLGIVDVSDVEAGGMLLLSVDSETKPYIRFGAGVEIKQFFIEARFVSIFTEGESATFIPFSIGLKF